MTLQLAMQSFKSCFKSATSVSSCFTFSLWSLRASFTSFDRSATAFGHGSDGLQSFKLLQHFFGFLQKTVFSRSWQVMLFGSAMSPQPQEQPTPLELFPVTWPSSW